MFGLEGLMSAKAFASLGAQKLAYVKRIVVGGAEVVAVHAADGSHLSAFADRWLAEAALRQHDFELLSVY
jgi:hypothetical protein